MTAQGMARAAELLTGQYTLVITNVPYLARGKQDERLRSFCERRYPAAKNDLATVFLERCLEPLHERAEPPASCYHRIGCSSAAIENFGRNC